MNVTAICQRSGGWWAVTVPEVAGAFTQARRLDQVPAMVADAVSLLTDVDASEVVVTVEPQLNSDAPALWAHARRLESQARELQQQSVAEARKAVNDLRSAGFTVRDVATILHLSPQRVGQLSERKSA